MAFLRAHAKQTIPQTGRANTREVQNAAGGYVYAVDPWTQLHRFLVIGTQGGTYYVNEPLLTVENTSVIGTLLDLDGERVVRRIVEISDAGRAAKQDYGIYALALAASVLSVPTRRAAYAAVPKVCRTASTLFQFLSYLKGRRGWSRGLRSAVANWYDARDTGSLAYQMVKYPSRHGFSHRDLLRLAHPASDGKSDLYRWAVGRSDFGQDADEEHLPEMVRLTEKAKNAAESERAVYAHLLPREALPTEWLNDPNVWEALLYGENGRGMPLTALVRNLGNLSKCGLLTAGSAAARYVCDELVNAGRVRAARVHPMSLFLAGKTYVAGCGVRGKGKWAPVSAVVDALDSAFYLAFDNVEPTNKHVLVAVDASGSMSAPILDYPNVTARDASLAFGLVVMHTEPNARFLGFADGSNTTEFRVSRDERLRDLASRFNDRVEGRGTDCSIPFKWAESVGFAPDAVLIWTDSETWAGTEHPDQALRSLRATTGKHIKVVVAAITATAHSIGDPKDPGVLQICGFDASVPTAIAEFIG